MQAVFATTMFGLLASSANAQNVRVLRASDTTCIGGGGDDCINWKTAFAGDSTNCDGGGWWKGTYNASSLPVRNGSFLLTHTAGSIEPYSYWGGFTTGSNGDARCYTLKCYGNSCGNSCPNGCISNDLAGSSGWVYNQWGTMAGGGMADDFGTQKGLPYFISYWDYWLDNQGEPSLQLSLPKDSLFTPLLMYFNNHPWSYWSNLYGDGFARPLNRVGDHFDLIVHGIKADGTKAIDSVVVELASCYIDYNGDTIFEQSTQWQELYLNTLGEVKSLYFTMYSSDSDPQWGPNTAVYFNIDKVYVELSGKVSAAAAAPKKRKAEPKFADVGDYFPLPSYTGGDAAIYTMEGKEVMRTVVKAGSKIGLSQLPDGKYYLQHGSRRLPIRKGDVQ